ncbi:CMRF35-like molecule 8 isoform X2 [Echeneis naucrates]|uniref:CMRF35-like molecule 8 isoform X2 n=1 Tax=Echeneis naucrates TaxID=173247 RepID=UPI00111417EA|nr:CMRF35-like molecule 8 isoform X2 [Echeneis naucrates]
MAFNLSFFFILAGLTGIHSITTVTEVPVKAGDSVTIPCLYNSRHTSHVKYLCEGYKLLFCKSVVKTDQPDSSGKFSISDDKRQNVFTVTIKDLMDEEANYWCAVEIDGGADVGVYFHLSITDGMPALYVDHQAITGYVGDDITITCYYNTSGEMRWCRLGSTCVTGSSGSIDGANVTINMTLPNIFNVTMRGLTTESSDWYLCGTGDLKMPVHVTVAEKPSTTTVSSTTFDPELLTPQDLIVTVHWLIIPLSVLIIVIVTIWFTLKRANKHTEVELPDTATAEDAEVTYTIKHKRKPSRESRAKEYTVIYSEVMPESDATIDAEVVCSSVVMPAMKQQRQTVERKSEDVTYSSLVHLQDM